MEMLDIVDLEGEPTGETRERTEVHENGLLHRTAHVWLFREREHRIEVLLQRRSKEKDSYPDCYDISTAGHIPAGVDYLDSAIREAWEELGIHIYKEEFVFCGRRTIHYEEVFHGKNFIDNQITNVYLIWRDIEEIAFHLQKEEVSHVKWMVFEDVVDAVVNNTIKHCIVGEELNMLASEIYKKDIEKRKIMAQKLQGKGL